MALRLQWSDERYVRVYCRDTAEWLALSWDAQGLYVLLLRQATRAGTIPLGRLGRQAVAAILHRADLWPRLGSALEELERDGCIQVVGDTLVFTDFVEAQEAVSSGAARTRAWREKHQKPQAGGDEASREPEAQAGDGPSPRRDGALPPTDEASPGDETSAKRDGKRHTVQHSTARHGTARHGTDQASDERVTEPSPSSGAALQAAFAADLEAEAAAAPRLPPRPPGAAVRSVRVRRST